MSKYEEKEKEKLSNEETKIEKKTEKRITSEFGFVFVGRLKRKLRRVIEDYSKEQRELLVIQRHIQKHKYTFSFSLNRIA